MKNYNELIKIVINDSGQQLVSARDLHNFLESKRQFVDWIEFRIKQYSFILNEDYTIEKGFSQKNEKVGRPSKEYIVTVDMAKELSMVENNEKGKQARRYFIQCEKKMREIENQKLRNIMEEFKESLEEAKKQFKPSHKTKLEYNNLIEQLSNNEDEYKAIRTFVFATLAIDKWEDTAVEDGPRIMELINTSAALISTKPFEQTKLC